MFRFLGACFKVSALALIAIILSHVVTLKGRTISDQVKTGMAQVERSNVTKDFSNWTRSHVSKLTEDAKQGAKQIAPQLSNSPRGQISREEISAEERTKLKELLRGNSNNSAKK